jgi:NosR/NirI family transcriptional regulator, nitrous oxide reductase regulator
VNTAVAETWRDILAPQALDLSLLTAFIALALTSFFLKSVRLKYVALVVAVGYMGFTKSSLVSISDFFRLTDLSLPPLQYSLTWYLFTGFVIVSTVLWGRLYCGRICAFGALTQLMDAVIPSRLRVNIPAAIERRAAWIKYGLLGAVLVYYLVTHDLASPVQYAEPFWMFTLFGTTPMWIGLAILLTATLFVRNLYCRFLCPVGAALGVISNLTVFRIKRWSECNTCKICEKTCEWGAIRGPKIVKTECVRCDDCERLYLDQQKCPHWLIQIKRARQSAATPAATGPSAAVS